MIWTYILMADNYSYDLVGNAMEGLNELTLELTSWCPLRCLHCSSNSGPACEVRLEEDIVLRLIKEAASLKTKKVSFGGGEPTAAKTFVPALTRVIDLGMSAEIFTCGLVGCGKSLHSFSSELIKNCKKLPGVKFIFSIYGATAEIHDYITQTSGSFEALKKSLDKCLNSQLICEINFVPMKTNLHEFEKIVGLATNLGMSRLSVLRFVPQGRGFQNQQELELFRDEEDFFIDELLSLRREKDIEIRTGSPFNGIIPENRVPCRAGLHKLVIQPDSNVLPCEVYKHSERCKWGLSVCTHTLAEILRDSRFINLRKTLKNNLCFICPVHGVLRSQQKSGVVYGQIS